MVGLIVLLIVAGCVAFQYLKGTLVKAFAMIIVTICAGIVAFAYFEAVAALFIGGRDSSFKFLPPPWMQPLSFLLLFLLTFAALQTLAEYLTRQNVDLGLLPERVGRVVCGIVLGLILSSLLLTNLAMAPIPNKYPYQRFDQRRPDAERPKKAFFNIDALAPGLFSSISSGSLSGKRSFAALHPALLDQLFLNRHNIADKVPIVTKEQAIKVPGKNAAWHAPEGIKDSDGKPLSPKTGHSLMLVRVGINKSAVAEAGTFTPSQLRLICKQQTGVKNPLAGKGLNIYPIGYMMAADKLRIKRLNDVIKVVRGDFDQNEREKWIDFAFYVPAGFVPVLVEFKQNSIAQVPPLASAEQVPQPLPFVPSSGSKKDPTKPENSARPQSSKKPTQPKNTADEGDGLTPLTRTLVAPPLDDFK
ncbi:MAG: CvpA family protein [Planctomycetota bacterium]|jgi:hypothetical protein